MTKFLELQNVEEAARLNPDTFFIPSKEERKTQKIGNSVRLHFLLDAPKEGEPSAERMWVTVTHEQGLFRPYKGTLENQPAVIEDLGLGDEITFRDCHIARTIIERNDPHWIDSAELDALVSAKCMEAGGVVRFLYRECADRDQDSGWRMFSGLESNAYAQDSQNIRIVPVQLMLDRDPSLLQPLKEGVGAVYEREAKDTAWQQVTDWSPHE